MNEKFNAQYCAHAQWWLAQPDSTETYFIQLSLRSEDHNYQ